MTEENENNVDEPVDPIALDSTPWLILLTVLLLVGKVVGWWAGMSWLWVFSPLWMPFAFMFVFMALFMCAALIAVAVILAMSVWESR